MWLLVTQNSVQVGQEGPLARGGLCSPSPPPRWCSRSLFQLFTQLPPGWREGGKGPHMEMGPGRGLPGAWTARRLHTLSDVFTTCKFRLNV